MTELPNPGSNKCLLMRDLLLWPGEQWGCSCPLCDMWRTPVQWSALLRRVWELDKEKQEWTTGKKKKQKKKKTTATPPPSPSSYNNKEVIHKTVTQKESLSLLHTYTHTHTKRSMWNKLLSSYTHVDKKTLPKSGQLTLAKAENTCQHGISTSAHALHTRTHMNVMWASLA